MSLVAGLLLTLGCGASEEKVEEKFDAYVAERQDCTQDEECALAGAGCPLGCYVYVHEDHVADVEDEAQRLIKRYERGGRSCQYDCVPATVPVCVAGRCQGADE